MLDALTDMQKARGALEKSLFVAIREFEESTGTWVESIQLAHAQHSSSATDGIVITHTSGLRVRAIL